MQPLRTILFAADFSEIVMGRHGRTGLARALMRSVAEAVLLKAGRPAMVVKPAERVATEPADRSATPMFTVV
jgi:nucleotide-binding universal stress UspA family protein